MPNLSPARRLGLAAAGAALAASACNDPTSVRELNGLPAQTIAGGLTASQTQLLVVGLANRDRDIAGQRYLAYGGILARDLHYLDPSEPRFQTELLGGAIDAAGFIGGGGGYAEAYNAVATANTLLNGVGAVQGYTDAQKQGVRGIAHTFKALALYRALELRGPNGIPLDNSAITASGSQLSPIRCEAAALKAIADTLDVAAQELATAGESFAVTLPRGFSSNGTFSTPAGFLRFNRGLKGRAEFYRGLKGGGAAAFEGALAALNASFLDVNAPTTDGVYFTYAAAPDVFNPLAVNTIYLNQLVAAAPAGSGLAANGQTIQAGDARAGKLAFRANTATGAAPYGRNGVTTNYRSGLALATAPNQTRPMPVLRNAELILLRAQVLLELGRLAEATADINSVRTREGGLPAIAVVGSRDAGVQRVLYEKRFSLLLEGVQRLVDLRAYGFLATPAAARAYFGEPQRSDDAYQNALPVPQRERDARGAAGFACVA